MVGHQAAHKLELYDHSEHLLLLALKCDETSYWPHHAMGLLLLQQERYAEAAGMFEWCYEQNPGDPDIERLVVESRHRALRKRTSVREASYGIESSDRL